MRKVKRKDREPPDTDSTHAVEKTFPAASAPASRRAFLRNAGGLTLALVSPPNLVFAQTPRADARQSAQDRRRQRLEQSYKMRVEAALYQKSLELKEARGNGDEELYPNRIGNFAKGLPHDDLGEVNRGAYDKLLHALGTGLPADLEKVPLGRTKKLVNPQAALAFALEGADSHQLTIEPPPSFSSGVEACEMVELYWQSLARDVPFTEYATDGLCKAAAAELSRLPDFQGPRINGRVTAETLFRGDAPGESVGPYISQFLLKDVPYGAIPVTQRIRTFVPKRNYVYKFDDWMAVQRGEAVGAAQLDPVPRFIRSGRDLAAYVQIDFTYQAFLNACLILSGMKAPADPNHPYAKSVTQAGFSTFGEPHILDVVAKAANCSLKVAWYQKWLVHRRLRPEEFGGRVHAHQTAAAKYPIHPDLLRSQALAESHAGHGSYLLPLAYPEGCPLHPAYPAGHAIIAGACATALKAYFDESFVIPDPVVPSADGLSLVKYTGPDLTVGGELNKLASNMSLGRDFAGVHWRSDCRAGLRLGEEVAISLHAEAKRCFSETFNGFGLKRFDGTTVVI